MNLTSGSKSFENVTQFKNLFNRFGKGPPTPLKCPIENKLKLHRFFQRTVRLNLLAPELFFLILAHPVYKM